ncbi:cob(I)yrinic acid a,c-diamide adenosyltransferase [Ameyamaea chiangmaiensis]|uniref:Corrinoid adenosyltransferase n=1 Tax=Ameyamaea chiangmaiensis TaxID=442969 RepID=A0A850PDE2_9PROT|nr:cob(I)yrinic acid a,c-diamide adenosyltransferase [Ameyamaea chiangmaiensis]MBS4074285.1 cob(I)yrinic acid a,c-diamide adenosyltransferase [Ameyamaea chiangmaiensis]NVN40699.1 cob(I)yrinic acid a,c-diamide adenosyltransferase [Ameyamaea chiangmaiensis]
MAVDEGPRPAGRGPVRIDVVTTRGGDRGETSLASGVRVSKSSVRIDALGELDEANAVLGLLATSLVGAQGRLDEVRHLQALLFDVGALVCQPGAAAPADMGAEAVAWIEAATQSLQIRQAALTSFILPGGSQPSAWAHLARTVVRRAERAVVRVTQTEPGSVPSDVALILNRMSDYLFVLGRHLNEDGRADILWQPRARSRPDGA